MYISILPRWNIFLAGKVGRCITRTYHYSISTQDKYLLKNDNDRGVRTLTMNDIETKNSLSMEMIEFLIDAIQEKSNDPNLRSIVINSNDKKCFSAGHNLKHLYQTRQNDEESRKQVFQLCAELMKTIIHCPVPIIAAVDGLATAAGCQLVAACDIVVATEKSTFSTPGSNFGIFCSTPGIPLVRNIPQKIAARMLFTGLPITALEAYRFGLVSQLVPNEQLIEGIDEITTSIGQKSRWVLKLGKEFLYRQINVNDIWKAYDYGTEAMNDNLKLKDAQEGLKSFIEKRNPKWVGPDDAHQ